MFKSVATLLMSIFLLQSATVLSAQLNVKLLTTKIKEMEAGSTTNVLLSFSNTSDSNLQFSIKMIFPDENWKQIMDYSAISIEGNTSMNKIISIHIPEKMKSGEFSVLLECVSDSDNEVFGKINVPLFVKPNYSIEIEKLKTKKYLFSGDTTTVRFLIRNLSNIDVNVNSNISNGFETFSKRIYIPKDSAVEVNTLLTTIKNLNYFSQQHVNITAVVIDRPETNCFNSYLLDVFPVDNVPFDGYNRFPVSFSTVLAYSNRWPENNFAFMYDVKGVGIIHQEKKNKLEFRFRGPDRRGNPILGLSDEYFLNYKSSRIEFQLGDNNFRMTELTESSRYGRGAKMQFNFNKIFLSAFYHFPRFYPEIKKSLAVYTGYKFSEKIKIQAAYMSKTDLRNMNADLLSLSGNLNVSSVINSSFEYALGRKTDQLSKAYKGQLNISTSIINSHLNYIYADKYFPGFISNALVISSGLTLNLSKKINLSVNYDRNGSKLALDTLFSNAPFSENLNVNANIKFKQSNSIALSAHSVGLEDLSPHPLFHYKKYFGRIFLFNKIGNFNANLQAEAGKIDNFLGLETGFLSDFYNGTVTFKQDIADVFSVSAFVNYQGGRQISITGFNRYYFGGSLLYNSKKNTFISIDYQSDYELKEYYRDRSLLSLQFQQQISKNHSFELSTNYNLMKNSLDKKEISVQLRYTYILNAPISRKKDVGSLSGRVVNLGVESVEGIIFNLNGNITVTDKNGNFKFPAIKIGDYVLSMDESSFAINTITGKPGPFQIKILPGRESHFEIELTKASSVVGKLIIVEDKNTDKNKFFPIKVDIDKLVVEASNESEVFRIFTSRDGQFQFNDLRPGKWNIKIYKNNLPSGYTIEKNEFSVQLEPGKSENMQVMVLKKNREIKIQKKF